MVLGFDQFVRFFARQIQSNLFNYLIGKIRKINTKIDGKQQNNDGWSHQSYAIILLIL